MKVKELMDIIEEKIPTDYALDWDNVGLLVGDEEEEIHKVYIALDLTDEVLSHAIDAGADMILTHHPLIFSGMKKVVASDFIGRRVIGLIENNIAYYAMHTNFDVKKMGELAGQRLGLLDLSPLEITEEEENLGIGCFGMLKDSLSVEELAHLIKKSFGIQSVKIFGDKNKKIKKVAMCPGAGKSDLEQAINSGADAYITGDIDHHAGIDSVAQGLVIIDAGHYGLEHIYREYMVSFLHENAPELLVEVEPFSEPFFVM